MSDSEQREASNADGSDNLISDIFGDSDDDVAASKAPPQSTPAASARTVQDSDEDSLFGSSDDSVAAPAVKRLKKGKGRRQSAPDELLDSDEEEQPRKIKFSRKKKAEGKRKKDKEGGRIRKKARPPHRGAEGKGPGEGAQGEGVSGDEYDSGPEQERTREDDDFIDEDDEHAELVREYEEDEQDFDDQRPDRDARAAPKKIKAKSSGGYAAASSSRGRELDPLSETLAALRAPKAKPLTPAEMEALVEKLQKKMDRAKALDDACYKQQQPATHKLSLLPQVRQAVAMRALHSTLLERDFLCNLRDWIEPRDTETLPSLAVRTAVYEMLRELPALSEHLKRVGSGSKPIGYVVVALRKHKAETVENKRLLKEIMDKWSRPIFSAGIDSSRPMHEQHEEVQRALLLKYAHSLAGANEGGANPRLSALLGRGKQSEAGSAEVGRARMPSSVGYLFTVQPESKQGGSRGQEYSDRPSASDEARTKLYKKTLEGKRSHGEAGLGKKSNPRAISMSVSTGKSSF